MGHGYDGEDYGSLCETCVLSDIGILRSARGNERRFWDGSSAIVGGCSYTGVFKSLAGITMCVSNPWQASQKVLLEMSECSFVRLTRSLGKGSSSRSFPSTCENVIYDGPLMAASNPPIPNFFSHAKFNFFRYFCGLSFSRFLCSQNILRPAFCCRW